MKPDSPTSNFPAVAAVLAFALATARTRFSIDRVILYHVLTYCEICSLKATVELFLFANVNFTVSENRINANAQ